MKRRIIDMEIKDIKKVFLDWKDNEFIRVMLRDFHTQGWKQFVDYCMEDFEGSYYISANENEDNFIHPAEHNAKKFADWCVSLPFVDETEDVICTLRDAVDADCLDDSVWSHWLCECILDTFMAVSKLDEDNLNMMFEDFVEMIDEHWVVEPIGEHWELSFID